MDRDTAVQRVNDGLGFRVAGNPLEPKIVLRMQEAQRDLERGKTLPKFLLQEKQTLVLPAGESAVPLPTGFLRDWDEDPLHFTPVSSNRTRFLERKLYRDAVEARSHIVGNRGPGVYVILRDSIDFIVKADRTYTFLWSWYKKDQVLLANVENLWLREAPEWLIGETGYRISLDLRDQEGKMIFQDMRDRARQAVLGDQFELDESGGMFEMGAGL